MLFAFYFTAIDCDSLNGSHKACLEIAGLKIDICHNPPLSNKH